MPVCVFQHSDIAKFYHLILGHQAVRMPTPVNVIQQRHSFETPVCFHSGLRTEVPFDINIFATRGPPSFTLDIASEDSSLAMDDILTFAFDSQGWLDLRIKLGRHILNQPMNGTLW